MPFLEQRRRTFPAQSPGFLIRLPLPVDHLRRFRRNGALVWSVLFLIGVLVGQQAASDTTLDPTLIGGMSGRTWSRIGALALAGLCLPLRTHALLWSVVLLAGMAAGFLNPADFAEVPAVTAPDPWSPSRKVEFEGPGAVRVTGWPTPATGSGWRAPAVLLGLACVDSGATPTHPEGLDGLLLWGEGPPPAPGELLTGRLRLRPPRPASYPGGFSDRQYLAGRGLCWRGAFTAPPDSLVLALPGAPGLVLGWTGRVRAAVLKEIGRLFPEPEAGLIGAVLLGFKTPDSREASAPFTGLGLAHLFSLSGLHVGIILGILLIPAKALAWGPGARMTPAAVALPLYLVLTGAPASVVRASALGLLALSGPWTGSKPRGLHLLGLVFWGNVLWMPDLLFDTGFRLSFLAAGGILAAHEITGGFRTAGNTVLKGLAGGLGVTLAAQWFTLPLIAESFGQLNLWSPLANLVAVPLFGGTVWISILALILEGAVPWLTGALSAYAVLAWRIQRLLIGGAAQLGGSGLVGMQAPGPLQSGAWLILTFLGLWVLKRARALGRIPTAFLIALVLVTGVAVFGEWGLLRARPEGPEAWQFDVDQGDCALLRFPDGWTCLIDTGGMSGWGEGMESRFVRDVDPFLRRMGISRIDLLVLTHGHLDHTAGTRDLLDKWTVESWIAGGGSREDVPTDVLGAPPMEQGAGTVLHRWEDWVLEQVTGPLDATPDDNENDRSVVLELRKGGRGMMLWMGDLETGGEEKLLARSALGSGAAVLKAGHHGSDTSSGREFLDRLGPRLVLVSCGVGNRYRHPSHGPFLCRADTVPLVRTDLHGGIHFRWNSRGDLAWRSHHGPRGNIPAP